MQKPESASPARRRVEYSPSLAKASSRIAHKFRNVLAALHTYGQFLLNEVTTGSTAHADATSLLDAAKDATKLTDHLLRCGGKIRLPETSLDLSATLRDLEPEARARLGEHSLTLVLPPTPLAVRARPEHVREILLPLLDNATQATKQPGAIVVEAQAEQDSVGLRVRDTGTGMDADTLDRAFEPLFTTRRGHLGVGLSQAAGVVFRLGGTVSLTSTPGRGSECHISLPRS